MPNKTRHLIYADRDYVVKLENGAEIEVPGTILVDICSKIINIQNLMKNIKIDKDISNE